MDADTRILILANPGHYRDSLVALLRTIPHADLILSDLSHSEHESSIETNSSLKNDSFIVLVDLDSILELTVKNGNIAARLTQLKSIWPCSRTIILVDNPRYTREAQRLGADCILPRSISAGEFLGAIRELNQRQHTITWSRPALRSSSNLERLGSGLAGR
jgi:DNA-binding NarL/FixJ family response regulator